MKTAFRFIVLICVLPLLLLYFVASRLLGERGIFMAFSQFLSLYPGKIGSYIRVAFYRRVLTYCDNECVIGFGTIFSQRDTEIHQGAYIGPQCNIGSCRIGKNCLVGSGVHIVSGKQQHRIDDLSTPIKDQGGTFVKVDIGEDCWLGNGAIVMADVGTQSVVGAGSVVVNTVEPRSIMGGNPAKLIKQRGS